MSEYLDDLRQRGLSTRLFNRLTAEGLDTREKLVELSTDDIFDLPNIGAQCVDSLVVAMAMAGDRLKPGRVPRNHPALWETIADTQMERNKDDLRP